MRLLHKKSIALSLLSILCLSQATTTLAENRFAFQDSLDQVRQTAKEAGLAITEGDKEIYSSLKEAEADVAQQKAQIDAAINWQTAANQSISDAIAKVNPDISKVTVTGETEVSSEAEANEKTASLIENITKVSQANNTKKETYEAQKAAVEAKNAKAKADYDASMAQYQKEFSEYQAKYAQYQRDLATYEAQKAAAQANVGKEGYPTRLLFQALNLDKGEPQARHGNFASRNPDGIIGKGNKELGGYSRILDSTGFFVYNNVSQGETFHFNYTNLQNATFNKQPITQVQYDITILRTPADGSKIRLIVPNDPTEGFIAYRDAGYGDWRNDRIEFLVTARYYTAQGQVHFSKETPGVFTHYSLNHNEFGLEYVRSSSGDLVEIAGSTIKKVNDPELNSARSIGGNTNLGLPEEWDTSSSRYAYKGAILASVESDSDSYSIVYGQGDMGGTRAAGQPWYTYWFGINTLPVTPLPVPVPRPPKEPKKPEEPKYDTTDIDEPPYDSIEIPKIRVRSDLHAVEVRKAPVGVTIKKFKEDGKTPLAGVTYELEWTATDDMEQLQIADYTPAVTQIGDKVQVTTDDKGEAVFTNLPQGSYKITEVKTVAGYSLLKDSMSITLPLVYTKEEAQDKGLDTSKAEWNEKEQRYYFYSASFEVTNDKGFTLPKTGGQDTTVFVVGGLGLVLVLGLGVYLKKSRKSSDTYYI